MVAGVSGVGKTSLAQRIAGVTGIPHVEIDSLFHGPGWQPREEFLDDVRALVATDMWVTEWQYTDARPLLARRAQVLVWLDLPTPVAMMRLTRRTVDRAMHCRVLWNGNVEPPLWQVLTDRDHVMRWAWRRRNEMRELIPSLIEEYPHLRLVHLRSQSQADSWLASLTADRLN